MRSTSFSTFCFVALLAGPPILAQAPSPAAPLDSFAESLEVRLVDLQVVVTDDDGGRVQGLSAEDFELRISGEPTPLAFCTEVHDGSVASEPGATELEAVPETIGATTTDGTVPSNYLLFIDSFFTPVKYRSAALRELAGEVTELLRPGDRMAVADYDGRNLSLISDWSGDPESLQRTLLSISEIKASIAWADPELGIPGRKGRTRYPPEWIVASPGEKRRLALHSAASILAVQETLGDPTGRKVLLLLSGGWPLGRRDFGETLVARVAEASNLLGYSIYPVHAARLADEGGPRVRAARRGEADLFQFTNVSLSDVAEVTGGRMVGLAGGRPLGRVVDDTRSYYWFGFYHDADGDDTSREIEVSVSRPGLEVRARKSFLPLSRSSQAALAARAAVWTGRSVDGAGPLVVDVGAAKRIELSRWKVPLEVEVPVDEIALLPTEGGRAGSLELRVAGLSTRGELLEFPPVRFQVKASREPEARERVAHEVNVEVERRELELHLILYDRHSERAYSAEVHLSL